MRESTDSPDDDTIPPSPPTPSPAPNSREAELEARIHKLEAALSERPPAAETDTDAIASRVIAKLSALASEPREPSVSDRVLVLASSTDAKPLPPVAPPPPLGVVLQPPAPPADPTERRWFISQLWAETRLVFRMYFDPRYRISRTMQFAMPGILVLLVFNYFLLSVWVSIPVLSPVVERLLAVFLGIIGYKLLVRETVRYREVLDYLAKYGNR